jgi:hypothetical protein
MTKPKKASEVEASDGLTEEQRIRKQAAEKAAATRARTRALKEVGATKGFGDAGLSAKLEKSKEAGQARMDAFRSRFRSRRDA